MVIFGDSPEDKQLLTPSARGPGLTTSTLPHPVLATHRKPNSAASPSPRATSALGTHRPLAPQCFLPQVLRLYPQLL